MNRCDKLLARASGTIFAAQSFSSLTAKLSLLFAQGVRGVWIRFSGCLCLTGMPQNPYSLFYEAPCK